MNHRLLLLEWPLPPAVSYTYVTDTRQRVNEYYVEHIYERECAYLFRHGL